MFREKGLRHATVHAKANCKRSEEQEVATTELRVTVGCGVAGALENLKLGDCATAAALATIASVSKKYGTTAKIVVASA